MGPCHHSLETSPVHRSSRDECVQWDGGGSDAELHVQSIAGLQSDDPVSLHDSKHGVLHDRRVRCSHGFYQVFSVVLGVQLPKGSADK